MRDPIVPRESAITRVMNMPSPVIKAVEEVEDEIFDNEIDDPAHVSYQQKLILKDIAGTTSDKNENKEESKQSKLPEVKYVSLKVSRPICKPRSYS